MIHWRGKELFMRTKVSFLFIFVQFFSVDPGTLWHFDDIGSIDISATFAAKSRGRAGRHDIILYANRLSDVRCERLGSVTIYCVTSYDFSVVKYIPSKADHANGLSFIEKSTLF